MLNELGKKIDEHSEHFNKELENIKKNQGELKNAITEMKKPLKGINSRLGDTEKHISDLEDKIMEITQSEEQKGKQIFKNKNSFKDLWNSIKHTNIRVIGVPEEEKVKLRKHSNLPLQQKE